MRHGRNLGPPRRKRLDRKVYPGASFQVSSKDPNFVSEFGAASDLHSFEENDAVFLRVEFAQACGGRLQMSNPP
jgi:hypothetical protein